MRLTRPVPIFNGRISSGIPVIFKTAKSRFVSLLICSTVAGKRVRRVASILLKNSISILGLGLPLWLAMTWRVVTTQILFPSRFTTQPVPLVCPSVPGISLAIINTVARNSSRRGSCCKVGTKGKSLAGGGTYWGDCWAMMSRCASFKLF